MGLSAAKVVSVLFRSLLRDFGYILGAMAFPIAISFLTNLFADGFMPWPLLLFLSLCDALAISTWIGEARRNYVAVSSTPASTAVAVTVIEALIWATRLTALEVTSWIAFSSASVALSPSLSLMFLNAAAGLLLTSLFLLLAAWDTRTPWVLVITLFLVALVSGTSMRVSALPGYPLWQYVVSARSDSIVAPAVGLVFVLVSSFLNLYMIWYCKAETLNMMVASE
jgi:hypothetical protein